VKPLLRDARRRRVLAFATVAAVVAAIPLFVRSEYYLYLLVTVGIYTMVAVGLNLLLGYAGQVSLGHAAFVGIGAYTSAILTVRAGVSPWLALIAAALITAAVAAVIGVPVLRLRGHYLAMATLGFGMIAHTVALQWDGLTWSDRGIGGIPPLTIAGVTLVSATNDLRTYYVVWLVALLALLGCSNIVDSRVGRAMRAVHGSELAANTAGVNTGRYKLQVFVLSAVLAGLAGSLYAHYVTYINPDPFDFAHSIALVVMVVIGGMASTWGAIVGAGSVQFIETMLEFRHLHEQKPIAYGLILMLIMILLPQGLTRGGVEIAARLRRRRQARGQ
jgi:branched-chain amino acid transport system permease protein